MPANAPGKSDSMYVPLRTVRTAYGGCLDPWTAWMDLGLLLLPCHVPLASSQKDSVIDRSFLSLIIAV